MEKIKVINFEDFFNIALEPYVFVDWARESFLYKDQAILPKKISLTDREQGFYNFMPSILPYINSVGIKNVSRIPERIPALQASIMLYNEATGDLKAIMDGTYITAIRTGAVAALAVLTLAVQDFYEIGLIGLGNCGRAAVSCLLSKIGDRKLKIKLHRYKDYAEQFMDRFRSYNNIEFVIVDSYEEIVCNSDVIISAITYAEHNLCEDNSLYKKGCLLVPIHTRGFLNCDLFFDKFIVDDIGHVKSFKYFEKYPYVAELHQVLNQLKQGRINNEERIIAYNIGLSIHDIYFANQYYNLLKAKNFEGIAEINLEVPKKKFWV